MEDGVHRYPVASVPPTTAQNIRRHCDLGRFGGERETIYAVISAPAHAWFSESRPGLVVLTLPKHFNDAEVQRVIAALEAFFRATEQIQAWIIDLSAVEGSTASQRRWFAEYEKRVADMTSRYVTRAAYIVPNQIVRGFLTAIFWIQSPVYPHRVFSDRASGERWVLTDIA